MEYKTIYHGAGAEVVEKKSRFIAEVYPAASEEEAVQILEKVRKKYWDARHHCWAYVIGEQQPMERCSDDGEPSGTAGKPILEVIRGEALRNVLIIVTRYFGGTLLGTGGLVRAYTSAAKEGLALSKIITRIYGFKLQITTDYTGLGKIQYFLAQRGVTTVHSEYAEKVSLTVLIASGEEQGLRKEIEETTNAQAVVEKTGECWYAEIDGEAVILEEKQ